MDGPHDLGGKQGFGAVVVDEPEEPFHADWEGRMWAMARGMRRPASWNLDWWRHTRELIHPVDYLTRPYFDQWMQAYASLLVDSEIATIDEIASGHAASPGPELGKPMAGPEVRDIASKQVRYDRDIAARPRFGIGDRVRTNRHGSPTHTRLPAYVRGCIGTIERYCGAHVLPDAHARGEERAEPLYTVMFDAGELWPEAAGRNERIHLDLWESYLGPA